MSISAKASSIIEGLFAAGATVVLPPIVAGVDAATAVERFCALEILEASVDTCAKPELPVATDVALDGYEAEATDVDGEEVEATEGVPEGLAVGVDARGSRN